ncbi:hypothetical protein M9Y10_033417 [Tritrichomonas musculus]|uniref:Serine/threonine-protein phosphatase n=1 Tax=Tritrichomonas musculus TaxID=1915356 RepID=A0ABR2KC28_9EUKA
MQSSSIFLSEYTKIITAADITDEDLGVQIAFPQFHEDLIQKLLDETLIILKNLSLVYELKSDIFVVGDLHGNIRDLIRILRQVNFFDSGARILFLGDYVDRGDFSIEVITLLFSLISQYPDRIYLLRGNHEFSTTNMKYGFKDELNALYENDILWNKFNDVFNWLPLAAIIDKNLFCVHGGISPHLKSIYQIANLERPILTFQDNSLLTDLMWSDPSTTVSFYIESERGYGCVFGQDAIIKFCRSQNYEKVIRAHQCVAPGVEEVLHGKVITVFSCSNYCDTCQNLAGYICIRGNTISQVQLQPLDIMKRENALFLDCSRKTGNEINDSAEILQNRNISFIGNSFNTGVKFPSRKLVPARRKSSFSQSFSRNLPLGAMHMGSTLSMNRSSQIFELSDDQPNSISMSSSMNYYSRNFSNGSGLPPIEISSSLKKSNPPLPSLLENPEECSLSLKKTHPPKTLK